MSVIESFRNDSGEDLGMILADLDGDLTAWGTIAIAVITLAAVVVGGIAAQSAYQTFRLEAEPRLVVRRAGETRLFWSRRDKIFQRMKASVAPLALPRDDSYIDQLDDAPIYLIDGTPSIKAGLTLRPMAPKDRIDSTAPRPVWPAIRIEVMNLGRSPAIQVGITWKLSAIVTSVGWTEGGGVSTDAQEALGETTIVIDGVGPNSSAFFWVGNTIGLECTLVAKSPGIQRNAFDPDSGKTSKVPLVAASIFRVEASNYSA